MNKKEIAAIIALTTTINFAISNAYYNEEMANKKIISQLQTQITQKQNTINSINSKNAEYQKEINDLQKEMESARRKIEKINAITSFDSHNVTLKSNATLSHMQRALKGTHLYDYSGAFVDAEIKYGVNAFFIAAIAAQESSWGNSDRAQNQNNLTGHAVYDSLSRGSYFNSGYESIMCTAKLLKENYLTIGGANYNGLSVVDVNENYCLLNDRKTTDYQWSKDVSNIANDLKDKSNNFERE